MSSLGPQHFQIELEGLIFDLLYKRNDGKKFELDVKLAKKLDDLIAKMPLKTFNFNARIDLNESPPFAMVQDIINMLGGPEHHASKVANKPTILWCILELAPFFKFTYLEAIILQSTNQWNLDYMGTPFIMLCRLVARAQLSGELILRIVRSAQIDWKKECAGGETALLALAKSTKVSPDAWKAFKYVIQNNKLEALGLIDARGLFSPYYRNVDLALPDCYQASFELLVGIKITHVLPNKLRPDMFEKLELLAISACEREVDTYYWLGNLYRECGELAYCIEAMKKVPKENAMYNRAQNLLARQEGRELKPSLFDKFDKLFDEHCIQDATGYVSLIDKFNAILQFSDDAKKNTELSSFNAKRILSTPG